MAAKKTVARKSVKAAPTAAANDAAADAVNVASEAFDAYFAQFAEQAETFRTQTEELVETLRDNFEAAQTRFQSTSADLLSDAQKETAEAIDFMNSLARASSLSDALEIQRDYWTNFFETRVERSRDYAKASADAARETFEPFTKSFAAFPATTTLFPFAAK